MGVCETPHNILSIAQIFFKLFKINKIFENTLSLRVAGNGTKKPATTKVVSAF